MWGFDEDAVKALKTMERKPDTDVNLAHKYSILLGKESELLLDTVINVCKYIIYRLAGYK